VPASGDYDDGEIGGMIGKYSEKTCPSAALSITNPICWPDANPARRGGKPDTNGLSYGTAKKGISPEYSVKYLCTSKYFVLFANISESENRAMF
jgi:hypothetical protein